MHRASSNRRSQSDLLYLTKHRIFINERQQEKSTEVFCRQSVRVLHNGLDWFSSVFVQKGDYFPAAGSQTSQQKSHSCSDVPGSGSSWVVVRLQNHDAFIHQHFCHKILWNKWNFSSLSLRILKGRHSQTDRGEITHVNLKLSHPKPVQVSDRACTSAGLQAGMFSSELGRLDSSGKNK